MSGQRFTMDDVARLLVKRVKAGQISMVDAVYEAAVPPETQSQQALIQWWGYYAKTKGLDPRLLMAFPLQGRRNKANGARMKAEGLRAGTPDLFLAVPRNGSAGLWIELKTYRKGSGLTESQKEMLSLLKKAGYSVVVPRSSREAQAAIEHHLGK